MISKSPEPSSNAAPQVSPSPNSKAVGLTSAQIRAARALIRWTAEDLARETAVSVTTIRRAELTESETALTTVNDRAIRQALERAGVTFIEENGEGPGVRLQKRASTQSK